MISKSGFLLASVPILILAASIYSSVAIQEADAMKKGSKHKESSKKKISESLKKYHATGKTKKQRGE